ncbi:MAG TPA: lycopene cyclase domain-containing protein [Candidatus Saccharimonadales bacterium]|nr:lycopene cyclase domain-containing protein [Candidatus Saccharimonadales bacterium]
MRWFYALFNLAILTTPLAGYILWRPTFWLGWRRLLRAWLIVSGAWIALDIYSVSQGWWRYNSDYILGPKIAGLPLEEIAFFFVVPLACVIVFTLVRQYVPGTIRQAYARYMLLALGIAVWFFINIYQDRPRTGLDGFLVLFTILVLWRSRLTTTVAFWYWNALVLTLCLVFNTMLTALPVVIYDESLMSGLRLGTIPVEDFLYNFSLLNLFLLVVLSDGLRLRRLWPRK